MPAPSCASAGYFLLSDLTGLPNLHERCFALARRQLRITLFGYTTPDPEPALSSAAQRAMIGFALLTWLYRLTLFLAISVLVPTRCFKLLGIFLMGVEIGWFTFVLPIAREWPQSLAKKRVGGGDRWPGLFC